MAIDTLERAARLNPKGYRPVDAALQQPTPAVSPQPLVPQAPQPFHISPLPASLTTPNVYQQQSRIAGVPHIDLPITQSSVTATTQATTGVSINTVAASTGSGFSVVNVDASDTLPKGGLISSDGAQNRVEPVGANDTVLVADSSQSLGIAWKPLGGDISGPPNTATVVGLEGVQLDAASIGAPADGDIVTYSSTAGKYVARAAPSPPASVDYVLLSDGASTPSPISDGAGNFIYVALS